MYIRRFKQWWQVISTTSGGTIAQFLSRTQAMEFVATGGMFPVFRNVAWQEVSNS